MMASSAFFSTAATSSLNSCLFNVSTTAAMANNGNSSSFAAPFSSRPRLMDGARRRSLALPVRSSDSISLEAVSSGAVAVLSEEEEEAAAAEAKIGSRIRVKVPLKVYHVPKVPEIDLCGREGLLKLYVAVWKGKRISANLPFKFEFVVDVEGRGPVKFFAHLKEDEFEYLD